MAESRALMEQYARLRFPLPFQDVFEYQCHEQYDYACGDIVLAPFGNRIIPGVIWEISTESSYIKDLNSQSKSLTNPKITKKNAQSDLIQPHLNKQDDLFAELKMRQVSSEPFLKENCPSTDKNIIIKQHNSSGNISKKPKPLKFLREILIKRAYSDSMRQFIDKASAYTCVPAGSILKLSLNPKFLSNIPAKKSVYSLFSAQIEKQNQVDNQPDPFLSKDKPIFKKPCNLKNTSITKKTLTPSRMRVIHVLQTANTPLSSKEICQTAHVSMSVLKALIDLKIVRKETKLDELIYNPPILENPFLKLTKAQKSAVEDCLFYFHTQKPVLLDGITGSGKTEVYLELIENILKKDKNNQCLILLPEIALTPAIIQRLEKRFQTKPAQWHSSLTKSQRRKTWNAILSGKATLITGARSALFLPYKNLKLIIVDEEHDASYKQDEGVCYQARDLAVLRAKMERKNLILASATPAMETLYNARQGKYGHVQLDTRPGQAFLPEIKTIDLRKYAPKWKNWLSPFLIKEITETLKKQEQTLLFLNRRGYAPLVICSSCGERMKSPDTDHWLSEHKRNGKLVCHKTGFSMPKPEFCPYCEKKDSLKPIGPGVERILEEVKTLFPDKKSCILSSDMFSSFDLLRDQLNQITKGDMDIIIGTQMIAKGHNFPKLTLVGVIDADLGLQGGDLRATERTYQLMAQVTGRAGRAEKKGRAYLQTYAPDHIAFQALVQKNRDAFIETELKDRKRSGLPPYARLAMITFSSKNETHLIKAVKHAASLIPVTEGIEVIGPAEPAIAQLRGKFRQRFILKSRKKQDLSGYVLFWKNRLSIPSSIRVQIDIDPYNFL